MARIFISYSRTDEVFARQLATSLSQLGADVWIDIDDIPSGMKWSRAIQEGLDVSDVLLVVISPDSMGSHNVEDEWQYYLDQKKPVIPLLLTPTKLHFQLSRIQYVDFHRQAYDKSLRQLHAELGRKGIKLEAPPRRTATQQVARVQGVSTAEPARKFPFVWLVGGVIVLVIGIGLGLFLSNPDRFRSDVNSPTQVREQMIATPTEPSQAVLIPPTPPDKGQGIEQVSNESVYDSGGIYFEYPPGWRADTINDGGGTVIIVGNSQTAIDNWRSESFSLDNGVADGQIAIAIIPNIEDSLAIGDAYDVWDVADTLQQALLNSGYYTFSDVSEYDVTSGEMVYTLGSGYSYSVDLAVIDTDDDAGFVLIFGAAAFDQVTELVTTINTIATSLEI
jgi:hypothetical protein